MPTCSTMQYDDPSYMGIDGYPSTADGYLGSADGYPVPLAAAAWDQPGSLSSIPILDEVDSLPADHMTPSHMTPEDPGNFGLSVAVSVTGTQAVRTPTGDQVLTPSSSHVVVRLTNPGSVNVRHSEPPSVHQPNTPHRNHGNTFANNQDNRGNQATPNNQSVPSNQAVLGSQNKRENSSNQGNASKGVPNNGADSLPRKPNPQTQFIKRSGSVEIKRGSSSPRNSYLGGRESGAGDTQCGDSHAGNSCLADPPRSESPPPAKRIGRDMDNSESSSAGSLAETSVKLQHDESPSMESRPLLQGGAQGGLAQRSEPSPCAGSQASVQGGATAQARLVHKPFRIQSNIVPVSCSPGGATSQSNVPVHPTDQSKPHSSSQQAKSAASKPVQEKSQRSTAPPQSLPVVSMVNQKPKTNGCHGNSTGALSANQQAGSLSTNKVSGSQPRLPSVSSPQSPGSPGFLQLVPRSGSVTSQVSQSSVCSETGEKKRPKLSVVPIAIDSDNPSPCMEAANTQPHQGTSQGRQKSGQGHSERVSAHAPSAQSSVDSGVQSPTEESSSYSGSPSGGTPLQDGGTSFSCSSGDVTSCPSSGLCSPVSGSHSSDAIVPSATSPSGESHLESPGDSPQHIGDSLSHPKYKKHYKSPTGLSAINNNYVPSDNQNLVKPHRKEAGVTSKSKSGSKLGHGSRSHEVHEDKSHRNRSGPSSSQAGQNNSQTSAERSTVRKVKQRKRRSKDAGNNSGGGDSQPARISYVPGDVVSKQAGDNISTSSPDRQRKHSKSSRDQSSAQPKFKQYGFIDDPEVLANRDAGNGCHSNKGHKSLSRQSSQTSCHGNSRHGSRSSSKERTSPKHGSSRDKSKSRESSRERGRKSGSRERQTHKGNINNICSPPSQTDRPGTLDNAAFINGDSGNHGSAGSHSNKRSNKHGRRKHERDAQYSASLERRHKRMSTGDRTFPDPGQGQHQGQTTNSHHGNQDNMEDEVFMETSIDLNPPGKVKRGRDSRENRHSVPNMDNRAYQLDR